MGVMVRLPDGDRERFETATAYHRDPDGYLVVTDADNEQVALLSPGWIAAFEYPFKKASDVHVHVNVDGKQMRQVAASETSKALNALADSISKKRG